MRALLVLKTMWAALTTRKKLYFVSISMSVLSSYHFTSTDAASARDSSLHLKVMSATFLLVCFVCLKESTCETRKNVFYFTSKALLVLEIINFRHFRYSNIMTSSNVQA